MLRNVTPALVINMVMGLIYVWSLFLLPIEAALHTDRGALSLIPALALAAFTAGMAIYSRILLRLGAVMFSVIVFALLGGGHLLFGFWPSYFTLLFGYGLVFGVAAGFGYGLALSLATGVPDTHRALAIDRTVRPAGRTGGRQLHRLGRPLPAAELRAGPDGPCRAVRRP